MKFFTIVISIVISIVFSFHIFAEELQTKETKASGLNLSTPAQTRYEKGGESLGDASKMMFEYLFQGGKKQFVQKNNLYYLGAGVPATYWAFEEDKRLLGYYRKKSLPKYIDIIGDMGVFLNFPLASIGTWYVGEKRGDTKLKRFAVEYASALYLTLLESGLLSYVPIHERPDTNELSFWESDFRGKSSFFSGHVVPYSVLFFKTLQFYGPYYAIVPLALTYCSAYQRVQDGKHWPSDLVGAFFFSAMASEGVRAAADGKDNHPFYKMLFEHEVSVSVLNYKNAWGPKVSFSY